MKNHLHIKKELFEACLLFVENKLSTVEEIIASNQKALQSETKSSAGDKHDTARAMMQLDVEKMAIQLAEAQKLKIALSNINPDSVHTKIQLGSVIKTNTASYFISICAGLIDMDGVAYYAISPVTPIGKMMIGLSVGEAFSFNGRDFEILGIE